MIITSVMASSLRRKTRVRQTALFLGAIRPPTHPHRMADSTP